MRNRHCVNCTADACNQRPVKSGFHQVLRASGLNLAKTPYCGIQGDLLKSNSNARASARILGDLQFPRTTGQYFGRCGIQRRPPHRFRVPARDLCAVLSLYALRDLDPALAITYLPSRRAHSISSSNDSRGGSSQLFVLSCGFCPHTSTSMGSICGDRLGLVAYLFR